MGFGPGRVEQPRVVVVGKDDAQQVEHELTDVEVFSQMAFPDGKLDGAAQLALEPREMLDHRIADGTGPVVELDGGSMHRTAVRQAPVHGPAGANGRTARAGAASRAEPSTRAGRRLA